MCFVFLLSLISKCIHISFCQRNTLSLFKKMSTSYNVLRNASSIASRLSGKIAIVTASTEGIGFAIAQRLAQEGAKVVISSRKEKNVQEALKKLHNEGLKEVLGIPCHVGNKKDRENLFNLVSEKFGGLDILVSNAAVNPFVGDIFDCPEEAWDKIFDINVKSSFMLTQEALPLIRKRGGGSIIYISSIAGYQPVPPLGAYSVSKSALLGLTKAGALDLAKENIRVNCVGPGIIKTKFSAALHESEEILEISLRNIAMKRLGRPEEIAGTVAFLSSEDASYITGETILVSGGYPCRL